MAEQKWACGCYEVEGQLVQKCTQVKPQTGDDGLTANQTVFYSPKCYRPQPVSTLTTSEEDATTN